MDVDASPKPRPAVGHPTTQKRHQVAHEKRRAARPDADRGPAPIGRVAGLVERVLERALVSRETRGMFSEPSTANAPRDDHALAGRRSPAPAARDRNLKKNVIRLCAGSTHCASRQPRTRRPTAAARDRASRWFQTGRVEPLSRPAPPKSLLRERGVRLPARGGRRKSAVCRAAKIVCDERLRNDGTETLSGQEAGAR